MCTYVYIYIYIYIYNNMYYNRYIYICIYIHMHHNKDGFTGCTFIWGSDHDLTNYFTDFCQAPSELGRLWLFLPPYVLLGALTHT